MSRNDILQRFTKYDLSDTRITADAGVLDVNAIVDALAAAERELAGVRKVEAWSRHDMRRIIVLDGCVSAEQRPRLSEDYAVRHVAPSLSALGHSLPDDAAEEG